MFQPAMLDYRGVYLLKVTFIIQPLDSLVPSMWILVSPYGNIFVWKSDMLRCLQILFYVHPYLGKWSILTVAYFFFIWVGINHQPVTYFRWTSFFVAQPKKKTDGYLFFKEGGNFHPGCQPCAKFQLFTWRWIPIHWCIWNSLWMNPWGPLGTYLFFGVFCRNSIRNSGVFVYSNSEWIWKKTGRWGRFDDTGVTGAYVFWVVPCNLGLKKATIRGLKWGSPWNPRVSHHSVRWSTKLVNPWLNLRV